jgi:hypothetical protein
MLELAMAGGGSKERSGVLKPGDKRAWEEYDHILVAIKEILTHPRAARRTRRFMKNILPGMLDKVRSAQIEGKRDGKMEK